MRISDWSSDVCSSDLHAPAAHGFGRAFAHDPANRFQQVGLATAVGADNSCQARFDAEFGGVNKAFEPGKFEALYLHGRASDIRSEEHTSELQSLMRNSYAVFCLKKKNK